METTWKYEFKDLSQEVQKIVIEGHIEYLTLTENRDFTYEEAVYNLNCSANVFDVRGNVVKD